MSLTVFDFVPSIKILIDSPRSTESLDPDEMIIAGDMETVDEHLLSGPQKGPAAAGPPEANAMHHAKSAPPPKTGSTNLTPALDESARLAAAQELKLKAQQARIEWQQRNAQNQQNQQSSSNATDAQKNEAAAPAPRTSPQEQQQQQQQQQAPSAPKPLVPPQDMSPDLIATPPAIALGNQETSAPPAGFEPKFASAASVFGKSPAANAGPSAGFGPAGALAAGNEQSNPGMPAEGAVAPLQTPRTGLRSTRRGGTLGTGSVGRGQTPFKIPSMVGGPSLGDAIKPFSAPGPMQGLPSPSKKPAQWSTPAAGGNGMNAKRSFDEMS